jgi:mRNA-degrading endonuclease toxin of MazEF toxin-antitoxin module
MKNLRRGDVVWVSFPAPVNPKGYKRRPAVLVTDPAFAEEHDSAVVVPLSSRIDLSRPLSILVARESREGRAMGLRTDSRLFVDQLSGIQWYMVSERMGTCPLIGEIDHRMRDLLSLQ